MPRFVIGAVVSTPAAQAQIGEEDVASALKRHMLGDWGELDGEDKRVNDSALQGGERLFSAYTSSSGVRFWVITEADRSVTTVLLPEDY